MEYYVKSVVPIIESNYDKFTAVEKVVADFFIHNQKKMDFSIKNISELLFTSKSTLVRFAQKCGYHGYKEFIYQYEETFIEKSEKITGNTRMVLNAYQELLNKAYSLVDEVQIAKITQSECWYVVWEALDFRQKRWKFVSCESESMWILYQTPI